MYNKYTHISPVSIVGIGRVGLPLALFIAEKDIKVWGMGRNVEKIQRIQQGHMPFIEADAGPLLKKTVNTFFFPTTSYESLAKSRTIIITIGTPVDGNMNPVLDDIHAVIALLIPRLAKGTLLILRSTVSPGTTEYVSYMIEKQKKYKVGRDYYLAFCPERIAEGKSLEEIATIPQIIGGIDEKSTQKAVHFFKALGIYTLPTDARTAELAKLFTNMYRYINFAISNQFMEIAASQGRHIHEIVHLVNDKYPRGGLSLPGLTAGPCLFKDGFFLVQSNPYIDLITTSWKINESIPLVILKMLKQETFLKGKKVLLMGLAFKPDIDDTRESLSHKWYKALILEKAEVTVHDPHVKTNTIPLSQKPLEQLIAQSDVVIIAVKHTIYVKKKRKIIAALKKNTVVCDIWNMMGKNRIMYKRKDLITTV